MSGAGGWKQESFDYRDRPYRSRKTGKDVIKERVDLSEEHSGWLENVYNQYDTGSCVANATAAAYRFSARMLNNDSGTQNNQKLVDDPSRLFIYYNARNLPVEEYRTSRFSIDPSGGSENRDSFKGMDKFGVCSEKTWKWENEPIPNKQNQFTAKAINDKPKDDAYKEALAYRAVEYCRLDPDHSEDVENSLTDEERIAVGIVTLMQLKQCLSEGFPVVFGFWYYWKDLPWTKNEPIWGLPDLPADRKHKGPPPGKSFGGHTVLCIGYDVKRKEVLCQNSWGRGDGWTDSGKFWMPFSWITDWECTDDFWMIRSIGDRKK